MLYCYLQLALASICVIACWRFLSARQQRLSAYVEWLAAIRDEHNVVPEHYNRLTTLNQQLKLLELLLLTSLPAELSFLFLLPANNLQVNIGCALSILACGMIAHSYEVQCRNQDRQVYQQHLDKVLANLRTNPRIQDK